MRGKTQEDTDGKLLEQAIATHPAHAENARAEMAQLVEVIARSNKNIDAILSTNQTVDVKGGFIAEEFHAETFNMDAILKGDEARACTDRYEEWSKLEWNGAKLKKNDIPDHYCPAKISNFLFLHTKKIRKNGHVRYIYISL